MWFFKRRVAHSEFMVFRDKVEKDFEKLVNENKELKYKLEILHNKVMELAPLSNHFTELQKQFIDLMRKVSSVPSKTQSKKKEIEPREKIPVLRGDIKLTPLEQKALLIIAKMQNELGSDMFPVKELTMNLYPDHNNHRVPDK